jgi:hypothetical protein
MSSIAGRKLRGDQSGEISDREREVLRLIVRYAILQGWLEDT